jgi:hypothetical protein
MLRGNTLKGWREENRWIYLFNWSRLIAKSIRIIKMMKRTRK